MSLFIPVTSTFSNAQADRESLRYWKLLLQNEADDPIGYWSFDENSGLVAKDSSGNANHGTLEGTAPTWVDGANPGGKAINFPGTNERVDCGNGAPLDDIGNGDFSISFWMKSKDAVPLDYGHLFSKYFDVQNRIMLRSYSTANRLSFVIEKNDIIVTSAFSVATTPFDTEWNHIVLVINRITDLALVYMNTVKDATEIDISSIPADASNAGAVLWGTYAISSLPYEGLLDECRTYNRVLTAEEIKYLYDHPSGTIPAIVQNLPTWHKFADPATGWKASKTTWATADDFDAGFTPKQSAKRAYKNAKEACGLV